MSAFNVEVESGKAVRLPTAGKYCDRDIVVTAKEDGSGGYEQGVEEGKQAEYDRFWDIFQENGNRTWYWGAFAGPGWTDETLKPKYTITISGTVGYTFRGCYATILPRVEMITTDCTQLYYGTHYAKTIELALPNGGTNFYQCFTSSPNIENITIEGVIKANVTLSVASKLTSASVQSFVDSFEDRTGQTALTFTVHANVGAIITDAQKAALSAKNITLAY